jgi:hypothetical protein
VFDSSAFASSLKLARSDVSGVLSVAEATFDWHIDATTLTVGGEISVAGLTADGDIDFVGTHVDCDTDLRKLSVDGEAEWDHTSIGGELLASDCSTSGEAGFDDVHPVWHACVRWGVSSVGKLISRRSRYLTDGFRRMTPSFRENCGSRTR